jgi:hypothetical protein
VHSTLDRSNSQAKIIVPTDDRFLPAREHPFWRFHPVRHAPVLLIERESKFQLMKVQEFEKSEVLCVSEGAGPAEENFMSLSMISIRYDVHISNLHPQILFKKFLPDDVSSTVMLSSSMFTQSHAKVERSLLD